MYLRGVGTVKPRNQIPQTQDNESLLTNGVI